MESMVTAIETIMKTTSGIDAFRIKEACPDLNFCGASFGGKTKIQSLIGFC